MIHLLTKKRVLFEDKEVNHNIKMADIINDLKDKQIIALDVETNGVDPINNYVLMLQLGTENNQYVIDARDYDIRKLKPILEDNNKVFVGHNIKFDYNMLKRYDIVLGRVYDTMLSDIVIYNGYYSKDYIKKNKRFSLAGVYRHHFSKEMDKEIRNTIMYIGSKPFTYEHIIYGANDVIYPLEIMEVQRSLLNYFDLNNCARLENQVTLALGDIEYNGMYLNKDKWKKISQEYKKKVKKTIDKLDKILVKSDKSYRKSYYQKDLFDQNFEDRRITNVNWSSNQQVYNILSNVFGIYPKDKYGKPSAGAKAIQYLPQNYEITDTLLEYREQQKVLDSFGLNFIDESVNTDNRVHTEYNQIVETGRVSSRKPNMQQIPRSEMFRNCFEAPKGKKIITADYSNQEGRIMADQANDESYIFFFNHGDGDAHSFVATKMFSAAFGKEFIVTKHNENSEYRQKGKTINFAISFGGTEFSLSKDLKISVEEAKELIDNFYKGFPQLKKFFDASQNFGLSHGYILTNNYIKRRRWFQEYEDYLMYKEKAKQRGGSLDYFKRYKKLEGSIGRKSMNTPIQGTAGDMTKLALVFIRDKLLEEGIRPVKDAKAKLVNVVHDECSIEIPEDETDHYAKIQRDSMEAAVNLLVDKVEIPVDQEISNHWTH